MRNKITESARTVMSATAVLSNLLDAARILALLLIVLYLPAFFLIALAIAFTSQGPCFISRVYRRSNGKLVDLWEFRTECWERWEVTPLGEFLRKSSIYRLPSLVNVLKGDIAIGERVLPAREW